MGQRHQSYIFMANPVKHCYFRSKEEKQKAIEQFGGEDFTILPYHNQWLYGRSALASAKGMLNFGKQFTKEAKTTNKGIGGYNSPITPTGMSSNFDSIKKITDTIGFILNYRPVNMPWIEAGFTSCWYLGENDTHIRNNFTLGDNNDGITIIDLVNNKYCFMNIYENYKDDEKGYSAFDLPSLVPVSAKDYVTAYYGETSETMNPYYLDGKTPEEIAEIVKESIETNYVSCEGFEEFEVLTIEEIRDMFPKMKQLKKKRKKSA